MKKDFRKEKHLLDIAAFVFMMVGIIMQISFYAVASVGVIWFLTRTIIDIMECRV